MTTTIVAAGIVPGDVAPQPAGFLRYDTGGCITEVGSGTPTSADDDDVVDLSDCWLIPGLIDCHSHLCLDPTASDPVATFFAGDRAVTLAGIVDHAEAALWAGVTTVRDLGDGRGSVAEVRAVRDVAARLPRLLVAGAPLTAPNGHLHFFGGAVASQGAALDAVRERAAAGCDVVKVVVSGGYLTRGSSPTRLHFSRDDLAAVVDEARRCRLPVAAHAHSCESIRIAADCGVTTIEHCSFVDGHDDTIDSAVEALRGFGGWVCPTLVDSASADADHLAKRRRQVRALHRAGVRLVAGTDAGALAGVPHNSLPRAVLSLVAAGLPPAAALAAATTEAAAACHLLGRTGRLAPGMDADVVAVPANPLVEPDALLEPVVVVSRGRMSTTRGRNGPPP